MTAFFIPGIAGTDDGRGIELAYSDLQRRVELEMGHPPRPRRIEKLWTRRGSIDCMTVVGSPDPLRGGTVLAIFDMGTREPFVVWRAADRSTGGESHEVLGWSAYSVLEFDT